MASLQVRYRPQTLDEFYGNDEIVNSLREILKRPPEEQPHSFLFCGGAGLGKTSLARIMAMAFGCDAASIKELDASSERGIQDMREIKQDVPTASLFGTKKAYIFDEIHGLSLPAQDSILKMLEEPPRHVYFFLCTDTPLKLDSTTRRRVHRYDLKPMPEDDLLSFLQDLWSVEVEGLEIDEKKTQLLKKIVEVSDRGTGEAVKLLDMVYKNPNIDEAISIIEKQSSTSPVVKDFVQILLFSKESADVKWDKVAGKLKELTQDHESFRYGIMNYMSAVLLSKRGEEAKRIVKIVTLFTDSFMYMGKAGLPVACYFACQT